MTTTLVGAAEPPPRRHVGGATVSSSGVSGSTNVTVTLNMVAWQDESPPPVREPYRTTAYVGEAVPEIESR